MAKEKVNMKISRVELPPLKTELPDVGMFPSKQTRDDRQAEIGSEIKPLLEQRDKLQHEINELVIESDILLNLDKLEKYANGEIDIQLQEKTGS